MSSSPKVLLVAFSARNAIQQTLDAMFKDMSPLIDYKLMLPTNYSGTIPEHNIIRIECGTSKTGGMLSSINPVGHWQVISGIRTYRPDVVHIYAGEGFPWAVTLAATLKAYQIPLIATLNDPDPHPGSKIEALNAHLRRPVIASTHGLHLYSGTHRSAVNARWPGKPITVLPHGSQAQPFLDQWQPGILREELVLFFGRLEYYKGIDILCEAMLRTSKNVRVAIAGPGSLRDSERALITQLGDRAELHNAMLDEAEVARLMQRASVMALPYRHVTQSSVPGIAASFGLPLVASALGHFQEEIPALNGILVPPEDPAALAEALSAMLAHPPAVIPRPVTFGDLAPAFLDMYRTAMAENKRTRR